MVTGKVGKISFGDRRANGQASVHWSVYTPRKPDQDVESFLVHAGPLLRRGFEISDQFMCRPQWDEPRHKRRRKGTLQRNQSLAALLFDSETYQKRVALILCAPQRSVSIDVLVPDTDAPLSFHEEMVNYNEMSHKPGDGSDGMRKSLGGLHSACGLKESICRARRWYACRRYHALVGLGLGGSHDMVVSLFAELISGFN